MSGQKEINALITLLDDPDREIYEHVTGRLVSIGPSIIPMLENVWEKSFDSVLQERIEQLIHKIQFSGLCNDLKKWSDNEPENLLKGAFLVARYQYPDLDLELIKKRLEFYKRQIWLELNYHLTPFEQVNIFNHVFYSISGFTAKTTNLQDPQNNFINYVLESKKGNAISLGVLYLILARMLDMPVYGINLPRHFILAYTKAKLRNPDVSKDNRGKVMFYINPLNKGIIFTREEVTAYLKKIQIEPRTEFYTPCSFRQVVVLMLKNLKFTYESIGSLEEADEMNVLISMVEC